MKVSKKILMILKKNGVNFFLSVPCKLLSNMISILENDKEIIVMKSAGLSGVQIALPGILIGFFISIILFLNLHFLSPLSYTVFKNYQNEIRYRTPEITFNDKTFVDVDKYTTIFFEINYVIN